jgi:DNA-binding IclR family transcriptional regulator
MSSLKRMLSVLDVFSPAEPVLEAEAIMSRLGFSRGTAYRYLRELAGAGLLTNMNGGYALGPRIIELDYAIRQCDPALQAGQPVMQDLCERFDCDVLLTSFFENRVIVSHHERGSDRIVMSYGRGRQMPLFHGCASKMILASLSRPRQRRLYDAHAAEIDAAGLGTTWTEFRGNLEPIRRAGYATSFAELDPENVGVAAPILRNPPSTPGSLVLVFSAARYDILDKSLVVEIVRAAAARICDVIEGGGKAAEKIVWRANSRLWGLASTGA